MSILHEQITIRGKVTKPQSGVVEFIDGQTVGGKSWFRSSGKLQEFSQDELVECTFRVSPNRLYLLTVKSLDPNAKKPVLHVEREVSFEEGIHHNIYFDKKLARLFDLVYRAIEDDHIMLVLLHGESGYGKSSYPEAFAKSNDMRFIDINCAAIGDPEEWFGFREATDGSTQFVLNEFAEALMEGNCIINLDEANRIQSYIANTLMPILDHRRRTVVHKKEISVSKRVIFTMTINEGAQFSGTFTMDQALRNRIDAGFEVGPLLPEVERQLLTNRYPRITRQGAKAIVEFAGELRGAKERDSIESDVSTRTSLKLAGLMSLGASFMEAVEFAVKNLAHENDVKPILDIANQIDAKYAKNVDDDKVDASPKNGQKVIIIETQKPMPSDAKKLELVALIREIASVDMAEAKKIVEHAQQTKTDIKISLNTKEEVDEAVLKLKKRSFKYVVSS